MYKVVVNNLLDSQGVVILYSINGIWILEYISTNTKNLHTP